VAAKAFSAVIAAVEDALRKGEKGVDCRLRHIFHHRAEGEGGKKPADGQGHQEFAARKAPRFTAGKGLKEAINS